MNVGQDIVQGAVCFMIVVQYIVQGAGCIRNDGHRVGSSVPYECCTGHKAECYRMQNSIKCSLP